jgi:hypothetical protein
MFWQLWLSILDTITRNNNNTRDGRVVTDKGIDLTKMTLASAWQIRFPTGSSAVIHLLCWYGWLVLRAATGYFFTLQEMVVGQMVLWIYLWIYFLNKVIVNRVPEPLLNFGYCEHLNPCQMAQPRANWTVPERRLPCRLGCYPIQPENYNKITKVSDIHQIGRRTL